MIKYGEVHPTHQVAFTYSDVSIECGSHTPPSWHKIGSPWHTMAVNSTLQLTNVQEADSGMYVCQGTKLRENTIVTFKAYTQILVASNEEEMAIVASE